MSKIPQGEWNAIAQRYSKGETLSSIARHYGCTPPAIHYILKRVKSLGHDAAKSSVIAQTQPAAEIVSWRRPDDERSGQIAPPIPMRENALSQAQPSPSRYARSDKAGRPWSPAARPAQNGQRPIAAAEKPLGAGRAPALTAELDAALQTHVETAIQECRSSFAAALAEGSPATRERLRQAAADLMRAAARTTIVLDRLNAAPKRARFEVTD